ncbi:MAG: GTPase Era [Treponema sp.]|jgi:GTP-binding protein Era|nr:GTPase Era [Treponema sp.]
MGSEKKTAFVAILGRPSVGKSSLVNMLCGEKVSIVSAVPQTTRNAIRGILTRPEGQLVFVDTPGRHSSERKLNKKLIEVSDRALDDSDLILYVLDASRPPGPEEEEIATRLGPFTQRLIAAINKTDLPSADCDGMHSFLSERFSGLSFSRRIMISCRTKEGKEELISALFDMAGVGEPFYPEDYYTDQEIAFRVTEIIREQAVNRLREELPHSIYVEAADTELIDEGRRLWVRAFIITERESQKGMVVGAGGAMIKAIRTAAQKELNRIFDWKVDLDLRVKTAKDWRHNEKVLRRVIK